MEVVSKSIQETRRVVQEFLSTVPDKEESATVVGLKGELGSGKTTFVQLVARELGVEEHITSPTFVIMKIYNLQPATNNKNFSRLMHVDAYRLEGAEELSALGFEEELQDPQNLIFIEWPERVSGILPKDAIFVEFEFVSESTRKIKLRRQMQ